MTDNRDKERGRAGRGPGRGPGRGHGPDRRFAGEDRGRPRPRSAPKSRHPRGREEAVAGSRIEGAEPPIVHPAEDRIAKVIARAGIASRRDAEAMIAAGRVSLNGSPVLSPALNVGPEDRIAVDGEPLPLRERTRLWLFNKPRGLVTTFRDPQGRPTVFEALPEDMPRVVAIGRLDINTEGLLLLTNDGGLAKVIAHPETGWTRRYRARANGEVTQAELDKLRNGITLDGIEYGPLEATLDRIQGDNVWLTLALREGKNREVKRILEHLGLRVNRLIRLSFGPFQLGDLEPGLVEEVRTKVLKEQLGPALAAEAAVDFQSPVREPIAPFRSEGRPVRNAHEDRPPRPSPARDRTLNRRPDRSRGDERSPRMEPNERRGFSWRAEEGSRAERPPRRREARPDPKAKREAAGERPRERAGAVEASKGRRVRVERVVRTRDEPNRPREGREERRGPPGARPAGKGDRPWIRSGRSGRGRPGSDRPGRGDR